MTTKTSKSPPSKSGESQGSRKTVKIPVSIWPPHLGPYKSSSSPFLPQSNPSLWVSESLPHIHFTATSVCVSLSLCVCVCLFSSL
jgi:hypothetical protein